MTDEPVGIAVIGFGFMGRTHAAGFERARLAGVACELRAICAASTAADDPNDALGRPLPFDPAAVPLVTNVDAVLDRDDIHAVSICTYTDTHVELAVRAVAAGKHVLIEKPVAISTRAMRPLLDAAARSDTVCAPALCMRYWPGWPWLRARIRERTFGDVREALFERISSVPTWSDFYADRDRSGGAMFDLHIHDTDYVRWCFGQPAEVESTGDLNAVRTKYSFSDRDADIQAVGIWADDADTPFQMRYRVRFDEALATFNVGREPSVTLEHEGKSEPVTLPAETAYDAQSRDFVEAIVFGRAMRASLPDAFNATLVLEAELESARSGGQRVTPGQ
jgi:predicted dehydrogenase